MKIKVITNIYPNLQGRTFDAAISDNGEWATLYDVNAALALYRDQFNIEYPTMNEGPQQVAQQNALVSLKDLLGYDVARIEFK